MKIEDLKVGELYHDIILGVVVLTSFTRNLGERELFNGQNVGTFERLMGSREYPMYTKRLESGYFRFATDEEIEEELLSSITKFNIGNISLSINEDDIYLSGDDMSVSLDKEEALKLRDILNKELN